MGCTVAIAVKDSIVSREDSETSVMLEGKRNEIITKILN
jgi:hypothetical protein